MHGEQRANTQMQIGPPLDVRSGFSFLEGASRPDELLATAAAQGWPALGVADRDGVYGLVRAHAAARAERVRLLAGARLTLGHDAGGDSTCLAWAADREGWATLCRLLTMAQRGGPKGEARLPVDTLLHDNRGLVLLWAGRQSLPVLAAADPAAAIECDRLAGPF
jgi:error-prone DNA polymerase